MSAMPGSVARERMPVHAELPEVFAWESDPGQTTLEQDSWLISFVDVLTLLLTLFVLLLAYQRSASVQEGGAMAAVPASVAQEHSGIAPIALTDLARDAAVVRGEPAPHPDAGRAEPTPEALLPAAGARQSVAPEVPVEAAIAEPASFAPPEPLPNTGPENVQTAVGWALPLLALADRPALEIPYIEAMAAASVEAKGTSREAPAESAQAAPERVEEPAEAPAPQQADTLDRFLAAFDAGRLRERVEISVQPGAVNLEISDEILFAPASVVLTGDGVALLDELAGALREQDYPIEIEGHTDAVPIETAQFPSNWELSSARATRVTRYLIDKGLTPARIRAVGYADTRPRASNATAEGRAANRRVSFVLRMPAS